MKTKPPLAVLFVRLGEARSNPRGWYNKRPFNIRVCYNILMKNKWFFLLFLSLYTLCTALILVWAGASFLVITGVLFSAPIFVLWNRLQLQSHLVPLVATFTLLTTAMIQIYAYKSGLWYELSPLALPVFGGAPFETYLFSVLHILYLILLYEYFFDDGHSVKRTKISARGLAMVGVGYAVIIGIIYTNPIILVSYPFAFLLAFISSLFAVVILVRQTMPTPALFKKAFLFALATLPLSLVYEWIMIENGIRLFANANEYLAYFEINRHVIPIEELLLVLIIPFGLVMLYEMFIDDSK